MHCVRVCRIPSSPRACRLFACVLLLLPVAPASLGAQHVRVLLTNAETMAPLRSAIVSLEREGRTERIAAVLSDSVGGALLAAPEPGAYRVRVDWVGSPTWRSPVLTLATGDTVDHRALVQLGVMALDAVIVEGTSSCAGGGEVEPVLAVWEEARKGVLASRLVAGQGTPALRIRRFERLLDQRGAAEVESADSIVATTVRPFRALRTPAELSNDGYIMKDGADELFLAPDAAALLSEEFVADHCLSLTDERGGEGLVGVSFAPAPERTVPEIAGTFWLDRESGEPRRLDYEYVNVDRLSRQARAGGTLAFQRLPTGHWIVSEWSVRTPRRGITRSWLTGGRVVEREMLFGAREEGAELLAIVARSAAVARGPAEVRGIVFDSLAERPLAGVRLRMLGAGVEGVTDSSGRYALRLPSSGLHTLELSHPRLALYRVPMRHEIETQTGEIRRLDLAIPSEQQLIARLCPVSPSDDVPRRFASLVGRTIRGSDGVPIPYAALRATWRRQVRDPGSAAVTFRLEPVTREVSSDRDGYFLFCHLPSDLQLDLVAEGADGERAEQRLRLAPDGVEERLLRLALPMH